LLCGKSAGSKSPAGAASGRDSPLPACSWAKPSEWG
jgi:hypothetical protein